MLLAQQPERALLLLQLRPLPRDPLRRQHVPAAADHRDRDDVLSSTRSQVCPPRKVPFETLRAVARERVVRSSLRQVATEIASTTTRWPTSSNALGHHHVPAAAVDWGGGDVLTIRTQAANGDGRLRLIDLLTEAVAGVVVCDDDGDLPVGGSINVMFHVRELGGIATAPTAADAALCPCGRPQHV